MLHVCPCQQLEFFPTPPNLVWHHEEECNFKGPYQAEVINMHPGPYQIL